jgi:hypothetical protein
MENNETKLIWQKKYCELRDIPMFAPASGICYYCRKEIQDRREQLITGCDHCNHSFCD